MCSSAIVIIFGMSQMLVFVPRDHRMIILLAADRNSSWPPGHASRSFFRSSFARVSC